LKRLKGKISKLDNEQDLIIACIKNDPNAQKVLFERYAAKMLGICSRYCPNIEDARDALHEGFIKVFRLIEKFKGNSTLETWITRLMINTSIDHFKKSLKFVHYENDDDVHAMDPEKTDYEIETEEDETVNIKDLHNT